MARLASDVIMPSCNMDLPSIHVHQSSCCTLLPMLRDKMLSTHVPQPTCNMKEPGDPNGLPSAPHGSADEPYQSAVDPLPSARAHAQWAGHDGGSAPPTPSSVARDEPAGAIGSGGGGSVDRTALAAAAAR